MLEAGEKSIPGNHNMVEVKALCFRWTIEHVSIILFRRVIFETDCMRIKISWDQQDGLDLSYFVGLVKHCKLLATSFLILILFVLLEIVM